MIRVVLDTNIIISALLSPQGPPAQIFLMILLGAKLSFACPGMFSRNMKKFSAVPGSIVATEKLQQRCAPFAKRDSG
jgi:hypothetical protein